MARRPCRKNNMKHIFICLVTLFYFSEILKVLGADDQTLEYLSDIHMKNIKYENVSYLEFLQKMQIFVNTDQKERKIAFVFKNCSLEKLMTDRVTLDLSDGTFFTVLALGSKHTSIYFKIKDNQITFHDPAIENAEKTY